MRLLTSDVIGVAGRSSWVLVPKSCWVGLVFAGTNTRSSFMIVHLKTLDGAGKADRMHVILMSEQIMEVGDTGVMVHD